MGFLEADAVESMQADHLYQCPDLRLGAAQQDRAPPGPQPAREHRKVQHQRGIREHELREVDDHVRLSANRAS